VQSLKTKSVEIARGRLNELLAQKRRQFAKADSEKATFGQLAAEFEAEIKADPKLKQRSRDYRLETLQQLWDSWPDLRGKAPHKTSGNDFKAWAKRVRSNYSPGRFNGTLETLRRLIGLAIDLGILSDDPTAKIDRASVLLKATRLPDTEQLGRLMACLVGGNKNARIARNRKDRGCSVDTIKFLLFTGARKSVVPRVTPENIDLKNNVVILPTIKYDETPVRVPIFAEARPFFEKLLAEYVDGPLLRVSDPSTTLETACRDAKIPRLTLHGLRHLFATIALRHTKDVKLVASWLGHKDGGALLLKRYAHVLDDHSQAQAKKVSFFNPTQ
jgi:integrase